MISVIILTFNEEIHIKRCIDNLAEISSNIFIVDSFSTDNTCQIAEQCGASVFRNKWPGNQATQFNWALENLPIKSEWILRLDADEYLLPDLKDEITQNLSTVSDDINGIVFKRRHVFFGKWIKRGTYPVHLLRLFRKGKAVCEYRWMDEHIELLEGRITEFKNDFVDHNLNSIEWWIHKHNNYVIREVIELLDIHLNILNKSEGNAILNEQAASKRKKKQSYSKQPLFIRSFAYFIYRYIFKLGFFEGKEGFLWHFFQGWWYRTLVDAKIFEIKKACGNDPEKIKTYIFNNYQIKL